MTLLSIVTGTYNRLTYLQRMIASARANWPRHLSMEFVIVDGGSTDGTQAWIEEQSDCRLIQHPGLFGAIKAFGDGARAASGDYVVMANDDIEFRPYSLLRALSFLESHPTCGAVAFADNRHTQVTGGQGYQVMHMPALNTDGKPVTVHYAQVGMVRRWLGERCGWWGDQDPVMSKARTYGGDNFLSSRIWELGYSVDAVDGCEVDDLLPRDALRTQNNQTGERDSAQYYSRYPRGAQLRNTVAVPNPQTEHLRVLLMDIHEPALPARKAKEQGLAEALARVGLCWEIDYVNEPWDLPAAVRIWQPHLLLTQIHDGQHITAAVLSEARAERPEMVVVNWNGDAHESGLIGSTILEVLRYVDLQTVVNTAVLPVYERQGIRAAYWQIGYKDPAEPYTGPIPEWDVLFLGNCYNDERHALIRALQSIGGLRLGVYGNCPGTAGNTHYDFALSTALYQRCQIAVSDTYPGTEGFVSNRLFQALAAGAFVMQQHSPRLDELTGLKAGTHYVEWTDLSDLKRKIRKWRNSDGKGLRRKIAEAGQEYVRREFSYDAQVRKLLEML